MYLKDGVGILHRIFSHDWFYSDSSYRHDASGATCGYGRFEWHGVSYSVGSASLETMNPDIVTGQQITITSHAWASNAPVATEIYNQATGTWSSSNPSIVSVSSANGALAPSEFGTLWSNITNAVTGQLAGSATVTTSIAGASASLQVNVGPTGTLSDPTGGTSWISSPGVYTWRITPIGCNPGCDYAWRVESNDDGTWSLYGGGDEMDFYINNSFPYSFNIAVEVTSNGQTRTVRQSFITNGTRECGNPGQPDC